MKKKLKTMDIILIIDAIVLIAFSICMIVLFKTYGAIPDTLCTCVFAAGGGEFGVMGWIRTTKDRKRERKYELEDRKHREEKENNNDLYTETFPTGNRE